MAVVTHLTANHNPWHNSVALYRSYIIYALNEHLQELDGVAVTEDDVRLAVEAVGNAQLQGTCKLIKGGGWKSCRHQAVRSSSGGSTFFSRQSVYRRATGVRFQR